MDKGVSYVDKGFSYVDKGFCYVDNGFSYVEKRVRVVSVSSGLRRRFWMLLNCVFGRGGRFELDTYLISPQLMRGWTILTGFGCHLGSWRSVRAVYLSQLVRV